MVDHQIDGSSLLTKRQAKQQFREGILNSWGSLCACAAVQNTLDHVRPRVEVGTPTNLVCCCVLCNQAKGSELDWRNWFRRQKWWSPYREHAIQVWLNTETQDWATV